MSHVNFKCTHIKDLEKSMLNICNNYYLYKNHFFKIVGDIYIKPYFNYNDIIKILNLINKETVTYLVNEIDKINKKTYKEIINDIQEKFPDYKFKFINIEEENDIYIDLTSLHYIVDYIDKIESRDFLEFIMLKVLPEIKYKIYNKLIFEIKERDKKIENMYNINFKILEKYKNLKNFI